MRADGRPHVTPVVAVWVDAALYFATGNEEQKRANLGANPRVAVTTGQNGWSEGLDVVIEGDAVLVTDQAVLQQVVEAWWPKWDGRWQYQVRDGRVYHPGGFEVLTYVVAPKKVLAFAKGMFGQTVHRFSTSPSNER